LRSPFLLFQLLQSAAHLASNADESIAKEFFICWLISLPFGIVGSIAKYCLIAARIPARQALVLTQFCGLTTRFAGCGSFAAASKALFKQVPAMSIIWSKHAPDISLS
jgi:hypothetical protein